MTESEKEKGIVVIGAGSGRRGRLLLSAALASVGFQMAQTTAAAEKLGDAFVDLKQFKEVSPPNHQKQFVSGRNKADRKRNRANRWR